jgi:hypothetical protein
MNDGLTEPVEVKPWEGTCQQLLTSWKVRHEHVACNGDDQLMQGFNKLPRSSLVPLSKLDAT